MIDPSLNLLSLLRLSFDKLISACATKNACGLEINYIAGRGHREGHLGHMPSCRTGMFDYITH